MNVNIEVQHIFLPSSSLRGVPFYIINLIEALVRQKTNDYSLSFFDYGKQRGNRKYIYDYISAEILREVSMYECNSLSYRTILTAQQTNNAKLYNAISYSEYTGAKADIFHIPQSVTIPVNICGNLVVTVHDLLPILDKTKVYWSETSVNHFSAGLRFLEKRKDSIIISDSQNTKNDLLEHSNISPERVFVVPISYDESAHYPEINLELLKNIGIAPNEPYLLYLAAIDPRKGVLDIVDAFEIVKERFRGLKLVLAGGGDYKDYILEVKARISQNLDSNDVIMPGFVNDAQKRALLSGAEIFLFPSEYEGFGTPVLEAMACGAPVITSNNSSLPEVCGNAAVYVTPNNPEQLAYEIERLLNSEARRNEYRRKGLVRAAEFSWDKTARMTEEVYKIAYERR